MYMGRMGALFGKMGRVALLGSAAAQALAVNGGYGLTVFSIDDSMVINDASTPANNYVGLPGSKFTTTRASSATYWNSSGVLQSAGNGVLRRDFDPRLSSTVERCGYLIEEARTNLALRSEEFDNASWTNTNSTDSANTDTAPDGTTTMDRVVSTVGAGSASGLSQTFTGTAAAYTFSVFAKKVTGVDWLRLALTTSGSATNRNAWFNLATGALGTKEANVTDYKIVNCGNGIYRCSITLTCAAVTETAYIRLAGADTATDTLAIGDTIAVWGAQIELGSFASSYIHTTTASVTRAADLVTLAGTLFPLSQTEGTLYAKFMCMGQDTSYVLDIDANNNETLYLARTTANKALFSCVDGGVQQFPSNGFESTTTVADLVQGRMAGAYKLNDSAAALLGETTQTDIVCTMPTTTTLVLGNRSTAAREIGGWLFEAAYFPTRKTNTELATLAAAA